MTTRIAGLFAVLLGCNVAGTLDNVPNRPAVEVTHVAPPGPRSSGRTECPANPPTNSCPVGTSYHCELDSSNGCDVCTCLH
jgi:hypothetical protein